LHTKVPDYDRVYVIGASLSGLSSAYFTLRNTDMDVTVYERKSSIPHVICGEAVSKFNAERFGLPYERYVLNVVKRARIYAPDGNYVEIAGNEPYGFIINRKALELNSALEVVARGGEIKCSVRVKRPPKNGYVVVASGLSRFTCNFIGVPKPEDVYVCAQTTCSLHWPKDMVAVFFGSRYAPKGYAWVFPYGKLHRVGLGVPLSLKLHPGKLLGGFLSYLQAEDVNAFRYKPVPTFKPPKTVADDRFALVGDAGGFTCPLTGGGIVGAYTSGRLVAEALAKGNLYAYNRLTRKLRYMHACKYRLKRLLYSFSDNDFNALVKTCRGFKPLTLRLSTAIMQLMLHVALRDPRFIVKHKVAITFLRAFLSELGYLLT